MPVRDKAVAALAEALEGAGPSFNSLTDIVKINGREMHLDEYHDRFATPYIKMIDAIDWERVLIEASGRHMSLEHEMTDEYGLVCGECINEVLLTTDRGGHQNWEQEPLANRDPHA